MVFGTHRIKFLTQLFIENAISHVGGPEKWFTLKKVEPQVVEISSPIFADIEICEHQRIKGAFWEKLQLSHVFVYSQSMVVLIQFSNSYFMLTQLPYIFTTILYCLPRYLHRITTVKTFSESVIYFMPPDRKIRDRSGP